MTSDAPNILRDAINVIKDARDCFRDEIAQRYVVEGNWIQRWEAAINLLEGLYQVALRPETVWSALAYEDVRAGQVNLQLSDVTELRVCGTRVERRVCHEFEGWQDWWTELDLTLLRTALTSFQRLDEGKAAPDNFDHIIEKIRTRNREIAERIKTYRLKWKLQDKSK